MLLLVLFLYQTLPQLVPRTTLDFAGKLGDKQVRLQLRCTHQFLPVAFNSNFTRASCPSVHELTMAGEEHVACV